MSGELGGKARAIFRNGQVVGFGLKLATYQIQLWFEGPAPSLLMNLMIDFLEMQTSACILRYSERLEAAFLVKNELRSLPRSERSIAQAEAAKAKGSTIIVCTFLTTMKEGNHVTLTSIYYLYIPLIPLRRI